MRRPTMHSARVCATGSLANSQPWLVIASAGSAFTLLAPRISVSHRATVLYFVLTELLGYRKVRVYDGSWTEWGNLVGVPIER